MLSVVISLTIFKILEIQQKLLGEHILQLSLIVEGATEKVL